MSDGNDSALSTAAGGETMIKTLGIGTLLAYSSPGDLRHGRTQGTVALGGASRIAFATALIVAWREASPGSQMVCRGKLGHVQADFSQDGLSGTGVHTRCTI